MRARKSRAGSPSGNDEAPSASAFRIRSAPIARSNWGGDPIGHFRPRGEPAGLAGQHSRLDVVHCDQEESPARMPGDLLREVPIAFDRDEIAGIPHLHDQVLIALPGDEVRPIAP